MPMYLYTIKQKRYISEKKEAKKCPNIRRSSTFELDEVKLSHILRNFTRMNHLSRNISD